MNRIKKIANAAVRTIQSRRTDRHGEADSPRAGTTILSSTGLSSNGYPRYAKPMAKRSARVKVDSGAFVPPGSSYVLDDSYAHYASMPKPDVTGGIGFNASERRTPDSRPTPNSSYPSYASSGVGSYAQDYPGIAHFASAPKHPPGSVTFPTPNAVPTSSYNPTYSYTDGYSTSPTSSGFASLNGLPSPVSNPPARQREAALLNKLGQAADADFGRQFRQSHEVVRTAKTPHPKYQRPLANGISINGRKCDICLKADDIAQYRLDVGNNPALLNVGDYLTYRSMPQYKGNGAGVSITKYDQDESAFYLGLHNAVKGKEWSMEGTRLNLRFNELLACSEVQRKPTQGKPLPPIPGVQPQHGGMPTSSYSPSPYPPQSYQPYPSNHVVSPYNSYSSPRYNSVPNPVYPPARDLQGQRPRQSTPRASTTPSPDAVRRQQARWDELQAANARARRQTPTEMPAQRTTTPAAHSSLKDVNVRITEANARQTRSIGSGIQIESDRGRAAYNIEMSAHDIANYRRDVRNNPSLLNVQSYLAYRATNPGEFGGPQVTNGNYTPEKWYDAVADKNWVPDLGSLEDPFNQLLNLSKVVEN